MPYAKVNDINMYYEIHGEGEPLVFIPGGGNSVESVIPRLAVYSGYKVVAFDNRGIGHSDAPDIPYTMEMFADDLARLLDAIGIDTVHVVSESYGGLIAQHLAIRHPRMIRSLILKSTYCGGPHSISPDKEYLDIHNDVKLHKKTLGELQVFLWSYSFTDEFIKQNPGILTPRQPVDENLRSAFIKQWDALLQHDTYQQLPDIKAPTLIIHGEADKVYKVENAKIMASRIPNAELVTFPDTGHFLIESAEKVQETIQDFLRRHSQK